jgi:hypothetical protein
MRLKLIDAIEARPTGEIRVRRQPLHISAERSCERRHGDYDRVYRIGVHLTVEHYVGEEENLRSGGEALRYAIEGAERSIVKGVYGEVSDEVFRLLEELWEAGLRKGDPAVDRCERLLTLLDGKEVPA